MTANEAPTGGSITLKLHVWRQSGPDTPGRIVTYETPPVAGEVSFLETLDLLNERLTVTGEDPIAFDHDCREGICGSCGLTINGVAHGPRRATTTCQLPIRQFNDGDDVFVEPWRAESFPVIKDLIVDRSAFDRIIRSGGYITAPSGHAPDANSVAIAKSDADSAFRAASCIGCGACVAACPNGSAMLFTAAKCAHLGALPQGQPERAARARSMIATQDASGFGSCANIGECAAVCPKEIPLTTIARFNRDLLFRRPRE